MRDNIIVPITGIAAIDEVLAEDDVKADGLDIVCADSVEPEPVSWIWQNRVPLGKVSTVAGDGGLGKSTVLIDILAKASSGGEWPCSEGHAPQCSSLYLSAEDGIKDTIVPRLIAAGSDRSKIGLIRAAHEEGKRRSFNLAQDIDRLEQAIRDRKDVGLVVIDPISSYLGTADSHRNAEVRAVLEPLSDMADSLGVAIICNNHHAKGGSNRAAARVIGSVAFTAHSRAVTQVFECTENSDRRLFLPSKNNLALMPPGLAFQLVTKKIGENLNFPYVCWEPDYVRMTADEAMRAADEGTEGKSAKDEAIDFLNDELGSGPLPAKDVKLNAVHAGISDKALRSARESLGIKPRKDSFRGGWVWELPS